MINISKNTLSEVEEKIKIFIQYDDYKEAYLYYKDLSEAVKMINDEVKKNNQIFFDKIYQQINKLKFISLNYFDDYEEIGDLIRKHFDLALQLEGYDLWEKIKVNLLAISGLEERTRAKESIKNKLLDSNCRILDANKYKNIKDLPITVGDWLKNYHASLGLKKIDNLKRIEYLTNGQFIKHLAEEDKNKLMILFNFYEKIRVPSNNRYGFEGEVPMDIDGKSIMFRNGEIEEISPSILKMIQEVKLADNFSVPYGLNNNMEELRKLETQYAPGTFEHKVIEEEINRLTHD